MLVVEIRYNSAACGRSSVAQAKGLEPRVFGPVAQWIEHPPSKRMVARSNRAGAANDERLHDGWTLEKCHCSTTMQALLSVPLPWLWFFCLAINCWRKEHGSSTQRPARSAPIQQAPIAVLRCCFRPLPSGAVPDATHHRQCPTVPPQSQST